MLNLPDELKGFWNAMDQWDRTRIAVAASYVDGSGSGEGIRSLERQGFKLSQQTTSKVKYQNGKKEGLDTGKFCVDIVSSLKKEREA